jgi:predicted house-cleaning noncanonical NTP pyrophosphatase (MazG superfamily)
MLSPIQDVTLISADGVSIIPASEVSPSAVGWKAHGLASLPKEWITPFVVVSSSWGQGKFADNELVEFLNKFFAEYCVVPSPRVIVRSSGVSETIQDRGQLDSIPCELSRVPSTLRTLFAQFPNELSGTVHWVIQELVESVEIGHLSNERHLKRERRDWVVEFEDLVAAKPREPISIGVRPWRDGISVPDLDLSSPSEFAITIALRKVTLWAKRYDFRMHFEWVWNGKSVYIVQAEMATPSKGVVPKALLPNNIEIVEPTALRFFKVASDSDYESLRKLKNAKIYRQFGYKMPDFYVAPLRENLEAIIDGDIPTELGHDLEELTKRTLVIRTDGKNIPADKKEMLPRSDELKSVSQAEEWLLGDFRSKLLESDLIDAELSLVAHHFIPSVASAWARSEPGQRIVRIESLWGIPEGLYYSAHDTFEVDLANTDIYTLPLNSTMKFPVRKRLRFKGTFIGPDADGRWVQHKTAAPYDWNKSVNKDDWLFEIARITRMIADYEKKPVSVMWFIDNHPDATTHQVLPWFHSGSNIREPQLAAPRHKYSTTRDFVLKTRFDWDELNNQLATGQTIERVVLEPTDAQLIRNPEFAKELGKLAAKRKFVVELSGGILSHAYYLLQKSGAKVECRDLFGADEDVLEFNKVVRDKIPELIQLGGEHVETVNLTGDALVLALQKKLVEEALEALDAKSGEALLGELADIEEVIIALSSTLKISRQDLEAARAAKAEKRGGFEKGIMLKRTITPHSIQGKQHGADTSGDDTAISNPNELPHRRVYRRPDLRTVESQPEKILTFEIEMTDLSTDRQSLDFVMPIDGKNRHFNLTINLNRKTSILRETVTIKPEPVQLELEFDKEPS